MKLTKEQRVPYEVARARMLAFMRDKMQPKHSISARHCAGIMWPGHSMRAYGAAGAALRILRRMRDEGVVEETWDDFRKRFDWRITDAGRRAKTQCGQKKKP